MYRVRTRTRTVLVRRTGINTVGIHVQYSCTRTSTESTVRVLVFIE